MHLIDEAVGFMGSTAIVGGTVPVGVGLAYGMKVKKSNQVSCVFHGDAVVETGAFFESVNFAIVKKVPVLFICENNLYSVYSPLNVRQPVGRSIASMASGLGMPAYSVDGNDVAEVYAKVSKVVSEIRAGAGPRLVELSTYRWLEHCGPNFDNDIGYRTEAEFRIWKNRDPVILYKKNLLKKGILTEEDNVELKCEIQKEITAAFDFAKNSPYPDHSTAINHVYA